MEFSTSDNTYYEKLVEMVEKMIDIQGFNQYLFEEELADNTRASYVYALRDFAEKFTAVNKFNVIMWKQELSCGRAPGTVNLRLSAMERYCRFKGIKLDIRRVRVQRLTSIENVITLEEYHRLLDGLTSDRYIRHLIIVVLLAKTGARISEVLRFTRRDLQKGYVDIRTKGKIRRIYFPQSLNQQLASCLHCLSDDEHLCQNRFGKRITARGVADFLQDCAKRYGINEKHLHPHAFRHMFAIEFLKRNSNISLLADILGHVGVNTTMIYLRMSQEQQRQEVDRSINW